MRTKPYDRFPYAAVPRLCPGGTVLCVASGPSLTQADVDSCHGKVDRVIVVNNCYQLALWADALIATDFRWWHWHGKDVAKRFAGLKYSSSKIVAKYHKSVQILKNTGQTGLELDPHGVRHGLNSGYRAINIAVHFGASRILLLGYDMQLGPNREEHWHGKHPSGNPGPHFQIFRKKFETLVEPLKAAGVEVINCSRDTALTMFPRQSLESVLAPVEAVA